MTIVITGRSGSGKSELAAGLSRVLHLEVVNVGDELAAALRDSGDAVEQRADIGPRYLEAFGLQGYLRILRDAARRRCILDGLRIDEGLSVVGEEGPLVHVHRPGKHPGACYADDVLGRRADFVIPWFERLEDLRRATIALVPRVVAVEAASRREMAVERVSSTRRH